MTLKSFTKWVLVLVALQLLVMCYMAQRIRHHVDLYYVEGYMVYSHKFGVDSTIPVFDTVQYESCRPHLTYEKAELEVQDQERAFEDEWMGYRTDPEYVSDGACPEEIHLEIINYANQ